jgi:hypothetical protein
MSMEISEQELRAMIRDAIVRHTGAGPARELPGAPMPGAGAALRVHASHGILAVAQVGDGECIIEPSVRCDHCGYCKSVGH